MGRHTLWRALFAGSSQMIKRVYEIDGEHFVSLDEFYDEISKQLIPDAKWGRNLDAFNDILREDLGPRRRASSFGGRTPDYPVNG